MSKIENPCKINVFILALEKTHYFDLAINLKSWFQGKHPDYPRNIMDLAAREIERNEWQKAVSLLEKISDTNLDQGTACLSVIFWVSACLPWEKSEKLYTSGKKVPPWETVKIAEKAAQWLDEAD